MKKIKKITRHLQQYGAFLLVAILLFCPLYSISATQSSDEWLDTSSTGPFSSSEEECKKGYVPLVHKRIPHLQRILAPIKPSPQQELIKVAVGGTIGWLVGITVIRTLPPFSLLVDPNESISFMLSAGIGTFLGALVAQSVGTPAHHDLKEPRYYKSRNIKKASPHRKLSAKHD